jgi:hypothetical protein
MSARERTIYTRFKQLWSNAMLSLFKFSSRSSPKSDQRRPHVGTWSRAEVYHQVYHGFCSRTQKSTKAFAMSARVGFFIYEQSSR